MVGGKGAGSPAPADGIAKAVNAMEGLIAKAGAKGHPAPKTITAKPAPRRQAPVPRSENTPAPRATKPPAKPAIHDLIAKPSAPITRRGVERGASAGNATLRAVQQSLLAVASNPHQGALQQPKLEPGRPGQNTGYSDSADRASAIATSALRAIQPDLNVARQGVGERILQGAAGLPNIASLASSDPTQHTSNLGLGLEAAGLLPLGPFRAISGLAKGARALKEGETALDAARVAKDAYQASTPIKTVRAALPGAKMIRGKQEVGYSAERAARAAKAAAIMKANPGIEGHHAALAALRGELPKINFGGFKELDQHALDALAKHVHENPNLMPFQKVTVVGALERATEGKVPTRSEHMLLTHVFGKDTAAGLAAVHTLPDHIKNAVIEALNVPRSIMASFDLSAPFRQGLMAGARHPVIFGRNFKPMVQAMKSQGAADAIEKEIASRPTFHLMHAAKLAITDLSPQLTNREEQLFGYGMAEKIPIAGHAIRGSGRAYNTFLTKMRADMFDHLVQGFQAQGINVHDQKFLEGLGRYINASTGRGNLGYFQGAAPYLNTLFFSPRLLASRLNFMNPLFYAKLPGPVRKEALRSALQLTGLVGTTLGLAAYGGAKVVTDPRNADFAKIRIGNTRLDVLGGFQQPIRLLSQLGSGKIISSTTGDPLALGPQGPGAVSRRDIVQRFFEGKLAPTPSVINDWFKGTNFQGQTFSWKKEAIQHMTPLLAQDAADLYHQPVHGMNGIEAALGGYGIGAFGVGLQTYGPPTSSKSVSGKYEKELKTLGVTPSAPMTEAIRVAAVRAAARSKQPKTVHGRLAGDLDTLVQIGAWTPAERDTAIANAKGMSEYALAQKLANPKLGWNAQFDPHGILPKINREALKKSRGG